jgi:hypothetical protein
MLQVPASAEIVLKGHIPTAACACAGHSEDGIPLKEVSGYFRAIEGPISDHTGDYSEQDWLWSSRSAASRTAVTRPTPPPAPASRPTNRPWVTRRGAAGRWRRAWKTQHNPRLAYCTAKGPRMAPPSTACEPFPNGACSAQVVALRGCPHTRVLLDESVLTA